MKRIPEVGDKVLPTRKCFEQFSYYFRNKDSIGTITRVVAERENESGYLITVSGLDLDENFNLNNTWDAGWFELVELEPSLDDEMAQGIKKWTTFFTKGYVDDSDATTSRPD